MEFLNPRKGKARPDARNFRGMQSRITLKYPLTSVQQEKPKLKPTIKQSIIDDFERAYADGCDQKKIKLKNRNVSKDSPFDPMNKPPR